MFMILLIYLIHGFFFLFFFVVAAIANGLNVAAGKYLVYQWLTVAGTVFASICIS